MYTFTVQPAQPDIAQLRAAALALLNSAPITVGASVRYHRPSYGSLDGTVTALDDVTGRAKVRFDDQFGIRSYWCSERYLTLVLCAEVPPLETGTAREGVG